MTSAPSAAGQRRAGEETRAQIGRVALDLFTTRGYEATSMREIAEELGIKKASLYYHFSGKAEIVRSLFDQRGDEAEDLVEWVRQQPRTPELVRAAVLRWIDSFSEDKLRGLRFLAANPLLARTLEGGGPRRIGSALTDLSDALAELLPERNAETALRLRMAILSINAALGASTGGGFAGSDIVAAARASALAAVDSLLIPRTGPA
ncbi:TetR/AcrR family transcriptional regulator [Leifsonia sp. 2TAF2]|uniref:TetR/AcrR family transcriptional regulator n=1 Tax=Leifsonia sp. 2TAF2 TaxID=3233009 RepID=UPI003F9CDD01